MVPQPRRSKLLWFGLFPVRSPLLGESRLISVPPGTEMFHFPGLAPFRVTVLAYGRVSPFGHPEITARVQLPQAYRSLPRPSSPLDAKASTVCLIAFDLKSCWHYLELRFGFPYSNTIRPSVVKEQNRSELWIGSAGDFFEIFRSGPSRQALAIPDLLDTPERR